MQHEAVGRAMMGILPQGSQAEEWCLQKVIMTSLLAADLEPARPEASAIPVLMRRGGRGGSWRSPAGGAWVTVRLPRLEFWLETAN
jgi:hypothetical protein